MYLFLFYFYILYQHYYIKQKQSAMPHHKTQQHSHTRNELTMCCTGEGHVRDVQRGSIMGGDRDGDGGGGGGVGKHCTVPKVIAACRVLLAWPEAVRPANPSLI